jgi:hypothetical protein
MLRKKSPLFIAWCLCVSSLLAQSGQELAKKCVAAMGGEQSLKCYQNYEGSGLLKLTFFNRDFSGTFTKNQAGEKSRNSMILDLGQEKFPYTIAFDGLAAFSDMAGDISDLPNLNFKSNLKHSVAILLDPMANFTIGKETEILGRKAIALQADLEGCVTTFYIDQQDYTVLEIAWSDLYVNENYVNEMQQARLRLEKYEKTGDILFAMKMTEFAKGQRTGEFEFREIAFNPKIDQAIFQRPIQKFDYSYWEEKMN